VSRTLDFTLLRDIFFSLGSLLTLHFKFLSSKTIESLRLRVDALEEHKRKLIGVLSSGEDRKETEGIGRDEETRGPSLASVDESQGRELQRITQRITETRSELQKYKLVRNVLVGRGLNGKSRRVAK